MWKLIAQFRQHDGGATAIEYGFIAAVISLAGLTAWFSMADSLLAMFSSVSNDLTNSIPEDG